MGRSMTTSDTCSEIKCGDQWCLGFSKVGVVTSLWDERSGPCQKATRVGLACGRGMGALEGLSWAEASAAVTAGDSVSPGAQISRPVPDFVLAGDFGFSGTQSLNLYPVPVLAADLAS